MTITAEPTPSTATHPTPATPADPADPAAPTREAGPVSSTGRAARIRVLRYEPLPGEPCHVAKPPDLAEGRAAPAEARRPPRGTAPPRGGSGLPVAAGRPDDRLREHAHGVLRLLLEVLDGRRPAGQLAGHLTPTALRYVRAAGRRGSGRSQLTSLRICRPVARVAEVAAVYRLDGRARAVAARFELPPHDTWRCVVLRLG